MIDESKVRWAEVLWPRDNNGMFRRTLLEVAVSGGNFKLELSSWNNAHLNDPKVLRKAATRAKEYLDVVIGPEVELRDRWRKEDAKAEKEEYVEPSYPEHADGFVNAMGEGRKVDEQ